MSARSKATAADRGPSADVRSRRAGGIVDPRTVKRRAIRLLLAVDQRDAELSILLCDDATIHRLNRDYRKVDRPTDVLAFPLFDEHDPAETPRALGDVVISVETATRQASERCRKPIDEVTTLLIHGLLHLLGHDHQRARERAKMDSMTADLELAARSRDHRR
jgi:probable rRNA maturation factor